MIIFKDIIIRAKILIKRGGKEHFIHDAQPGKRVLDVGCGNNGAKKIKQISPSLYYIGLDIQDYNFESKFADQYILTDEDKFSHEISSITNIDYLICAHNLEHVRDSAQLLKSFSDCVNTQGYVFLSFPSTASKSFPSRNGTLNYYDDKTHHTTPPNLKDVIDQLTEGGFEINRIYDQYRPPAMRLIGLILEPLSKFSNRVMPGTWAYYSFETIIWAKKVATQ